MYSTVIETIYAAPLSNWLTGTLKHVHLIIIIAVVGTVPVLLILRAMGVLGGMIWRHRCLATRTSPSCSNQGHKHPLTVDSEDQHKVVYLMPVISPMGENADTIDSGVLPYCTGKAVSVWLLAHTHNLLQKIRWLLSSSCINYVYTRVPTLLSLSLSTCYSRAHAFMHMSIILYGINCFISRKVLYNYWTMHNNYYGSTIL